MSKPRLGVTVVLSEEAVPTFHVKLGAEWGAASEEAKKATPDRYYAARELRWRIAREACERDPAGVGIDTESASGALYGLTEDGNASAGRTHGQDGLRRPREIDRAIGQGRQDGRPTVPEGQPTSLTPRPRTACLLYTSPSPRDS